MDSPGKNDGNTNKGGIECTICLSNDATEIGLLRCKHSFCFECIESWSEHENSCPLCKVRFTYIDKVSRDDMPAEGGAKSRRGKPTRVKIKRKNQADHEPYYGGHHGDGGGVDIWSNFIASLIGTGNNQLQRFRNNLPFNIAGGLATFLEDDSPARVNRGRRRTLGREGVHRVMRAAPFTGNFGISAAPPRRTMAAARSSGGSANNPILLSDDEEVMRPAPINPSSRSQSVPDLVDLTDDVDILPSASARAAPSAHPAAAVTTAVGLDDDAGGLYNSEEDEDFDPSFLDFDDEDDDNSEARGSGSEGESGENEVIELSDTDSDASDRDDAVVPLVGMPTHRLSGVMVWCRDCDSFHDKQRVWDDRNYCRATYDSLMMTDGFADIVRDGPVPLAMVHTEAPATAVAAAVHVAAAAPAVAARGSALAPVHRVDGIDEEEAEWDGVEVAPRAARTATHGSGRIDPDEEAEWDENDATVLPARRAARVARRVTSDEEESERGADCGASSSSEVRRDTEAGKQKEEHETSSLATRTQSDATTCSSRSRTTAASSQMDEGGVERSVEFRKRTAEGVSGDSPSKRTRSNTQ